MLILYDPHIFRDPSSGLARIPDEECRRQKTSLIARSGKGRKMRIKNHKIFKTLIGTLTSFLTFYSMSGNSLAAGVPIGNIRPVAITAAAFPDPNFRAVVSGCDANQNGILDAGEIGATINIYCGGRNIRSLKGVEYFVNLQGLWCMDNAITAMDLSNNEDLRGVWCSGNPLTALDFSANPELTWVYCYDCSLHSLNISNNPKMAFIECNTNPLSVLDVTHNPELEHLTCGSCELASLDVSHNPKLAHLDAFRNHLTTLDVTHNPKLKRLDIWDNPGLGSIDISHNPGLQYYNCAHNDAVMVDVSHNPELQKLICSYNHIPALDLSHNPKLVYLDCAVNQLASLDLTHNPELFFLQAFTNPFHVLNLGNNPFLVKTFSEGVKQAEYAVCQGHSWTIDYGMDLMYFLCINDAVALMNTPVPVPPAVSSVSSPNTPIPADALTREVVIQILYDLAGRPAVSGYRSRFTDAVPGAPYTAALLWGEANHICVGSPDVSSSTFGVGQYITREDLTFMLYRYADVMGYNSAFDFGRSDDYMDYYEIDYYAWEALTWAATWDIINYKGAPGAPKEQLRLDPHGIAGRAEFAYMLSRLAAL